MQSNFITRFLPIASILAIGTFLLAQEPAVVVTEKTEDVVVVKDTKTPFSVLLEGRVHEAFAAPDSFSNEPPQPASKIPPAELVESKPAISIELEQQAVWVPGYWRWNAADESFVWTSGVWRFPPPNRQWLPGQWTRTEDGYVRSTGRWIPKGSASVAFVNAPPRYRGALLLEDSLPKTQFWVPGCWVPAEGGEFTWREGYVAERRDKWVWVPTQYSWTPKGWLFVDGYWDFPLDARGQTFASLKLNGKYDADQIRIETFAPIPNTAIKMTASGDYVYAVESIPKEYEFTSMIHSEVIPEVPVAVTAELPVRPIGTIRGVVHRGALTPANIEVELLGDIARMAVTDEQGRFEFPEVPFGVYHVRAAGPVQNHVRRAIGRLIVNEPVVAARIELE